MFSRAYCTATSYNIKDIFNHYQENFTCTLHDEDIHIEIPLENGKGDLFCFAYGVSVFWGFSEIEEQTFLDELVPFEVGPCEEIESDDFSYNIGSPYKVHEDNVTIPNLEPLTLIAVSHGIAQSVKLGSFELTIQKTYNRAKKIPEDLAKHGKISLSRHQIRKKMGELFLERAWVNLHVDVLEIPEFFWDYPEIEPMYEMMAKYLEISTRVEVLNKRLDVVNELFQVLGTELNHQHSSRLEWIIIWLIFVEVLLFLGHDILKWV